MEVISPVQLGVQPSPEMDNKLVLCVFGQLPDITMVANMQAVIMGVSSSLIASYFKKHAVRSGHGIETTMSTCLIGQVLSGS